MVPGSRRWQAPAGGLNVQKWVVVAGAVHLPLYPAHTRPQRISKVSPAMRRTLSAHKLKPTQESASGKRPPAADLQLANYYYLRLLSILNLWLMTYSLSYTFLYIPIIYILIKYVRSYTMYDRRILKQRQANIVPGSSFKTYLSWILRILASPP